MKQRKNQPSQTSKHHGASSWLSKLILWLNAPLAPIRFWLSCALHTAYILVLLFVFTPQFNTRDDTGMMLLAAGKIIALEPTEYLIFTNILIGHILKMLYVVAPAGAWYAVYLIISLGIAHSILLMVIVRRSPRRFMYIIYGLYALLFASQMIINLQFTITAAIVTIAGIGLLFMPGINKFSPLWKNTLVDFTTWGAVLLIVWAWMIRSESVLLVAACAIPCFTLTVFGRMQRSNWGLYGIRSALAVILCTVVAGYNTYRYDHWGKENYIHFNKLCGEFLDFGLDMRVKVQPEDFGAIMREVGWSAFDFEMMMNWFFMDEQLYSTEKLQRLKQSFEAYDKKTFSDPAVQKEIDDNRSSLMRKLRSRLTQTFTLPFVLPAFALLFLWIAGTSVPVRAVVMYLLLFTVTFFGILIYIHYMTLMRDIPERVVFPMFALIALLLPLFPPALDMKPSGRFPVYRSALVALLLLVVPLFIVRATERVFSLSSTAKENNRLYEQTMTALAPKNDHLYVIWADGFPFSGIHPFSSLQEASSMHALWLAWCQRTPTSAALLQQFQIQNIYTDLLTRQNCSLLFVNNQITNPSLVYHQRLNQFIKEHYGKVITTRPGGYRTIPAVPAGQEPDSYRTYVEMSVQFQ